MSWLGWLGQVLPTGGAEQSLLQYGALGFLALICAVAVWVLFKRQERLTDAVIARLEAQVAEANKRADDAERQLGELNVMLREQLVVQLVRATDAISRVINVIAGERRGW